jgi:hypothetical protein
MVAKGIIPFKEKSPWQNRDSTPGPHDQQSETLTTRLRGWSGPACEVLGVRIHWNGDFLASLKGYNIWVDQCKGLTWKSHLGTADVKFSCCNFHALLYRSIIGLLPVFLTLSLINPVGETMVTVFTNVIHYCLHQNDSRIAIFVLLIVGNFKYKKIGGLQQHNFYNKFCDRRFHGFEVGSWGQMLTAREWNIWSFGGRSSIQVRMTW